MSSENASRDTVQRKYDVTLKDGKLIIDGVDEFSIDSDNPKLNVGRLYNALFADINGPTLIVLEPTKELKQDRKALSFFESLKRIVDGACEKMNPGLVEIGAKTNQLDGAERKATA